MYVRGGNLFFFLCKIRVDFFFFFFYTSRGIAYADLIANLCVVDFTRRVSPAKFISERKEFDNRYPQVQVETNAAVEGLKKYQSIDF